MDVLQVNNLSKSFDEGRNFALENVSFSFKKGKICAIVGESGSGKTTLLRLISGLETPDFGQILINGEEVSSLTKMVDSQERNIGMVFQDYALFPHLTVAQNIAYGAKKDAEVKVQEMLTLVGLKDYEKRYPSQLSGGQQQRIALARALAPNPELLLLDEPFSNLDASLKLQLRNEIYSIVKQTGISAIFITHDTQDAIAIASDIIILKEGSLIQKGTVKELYKNPKTDYVASIFSELKLSAETIIKHLQ